MPRAHGNGVELEYETVGDPAGRPLLLVQGLGAQLISVEDGLCQELASRGFLVIRYDNRDAGLSTCFDQARPVNLAASSWAIMPPREMPAAWADATPTASSTVTASSAMSSRV